MQLNGAELKLGAHDELPDLAGDLLLDPATITFLALPDAGNKASK